MHKTELRSICQRVRDSIPPDEKLRLDGHIRGHLLGWSVYRDARCIFCFASFRSETDTFGIMHAALQEGKTVAVPRVDPRLRVMHACRVRDLKRDLVPGYCGILEPAPHCPEEHGEEIELIIAPGLAFTPRGDRLGYGGGFYDRFIKMHYTIINCALTYDRMIVDSLPVKGHDRAVDYLISETGVRAARSKSR